MLSHARVEVVLNHEHNGSSLPATARILIDGAGIHLVGRTIAIHIDAAVLLQLFGKLWEQLGMQLLGEVTQGVAQGKPLLLGREDILTLRSMIDVGIVGFGLRQIVGNAQPYLFAEFFVVHFVSYWYLAS